MEKTGGSIARAVLLTGLVIAGFSGSAPEATAAVPQMAMYQRAAVPAARLAPADTGRHRHTEADVRFMQRMIPHHAQALVMAELVPFRSEREDIRLLAQRIEVSQQDEIAWMQHWLKERGEPVPAADPRHDHYQHHHGEDHRLMPGMLTQQEIAQLTAASGAEFDRLFLEFMIRHHEGALVMVAELFATPGAGQEAALFRFASDVDADQRAEIERMRRLQRAAGEVDHR